MRSSWTEIKHITISIVVLAFAFTLIFVQRWSISNIIQKFPLMLFLVVLSFLFHELAHKFTAQRFGCWAEFRKWDLGLLLALVLVIVTGGNLLFAAPGAVVIYSEWLSIRENGLISLSGPLTNIILMVLFIIVGLAFPILKYTHGELIFYGAYINGILAWFNLFPVWQLDGTDIFYWNKMIWIFLFGFSFLFVFIFIPLLF
ncbi:MAG: site-2 protease family protein [Candidatus Hydrothermarchaeota archaeon]